MLSEARWKQTGRRKQKGDESGWEKEEERGMEKGKEGRARRQQSL